MNKKAALKFGQPVSSKSSGKAILDLPQFWKQPRGRIQSGEAQYQCSGLWLIFWLDHSSRRKLGVFGSTSQLEVVSRKRQTIQPT